ncbi:ATP-binding cassette domain-containing protein [Salinibius halmophilus]|uniref:ATP-binding cassette domain-containing protein n=1 Tax=Salinibius halmophilus TaxID=1853216 RepID=UPI0013146BC8|nr:ABC transporter ATP-binding protein [Salinibius halmophilus]
MLEAKNISVTLGGAAVLKHISFTLSSGSRTVLLGENGAGKTTLLRTLAGMQPPSDGVITSQARIAVLGQSVGFPKGLTVQEVLHLVHQLALQPRPLDWLINTCQLDDFLKHKVDGLSGGQHRRLAIALSLVESCDLLLLDEPSNALDYDSKVRLQQGLAELSCAIVLCTHDIDEAQQLGEQLLVLEQGELVFHGAKQQMFEQLKRFTVQASTSLAHPAVAQGQLNLLTNTPEQDVRWLLNQDQNLANLRVREISLNEAISQFKQGVAA